MLDRGFDAVNSDTPPYINPNHCMCPPATPPHKSLQCLHIHTDRFEVLYLARSCVFVSVELVCHTGWQISRGSGGGLTLPLRCGALSLLLYPHTFYDLKIINVKTV